MQPLDRTLRNQLERTVKNARDIAEDAARAALEQLGVGEAAPFAHMNEQDRELRRRLRVHGRQLGDSLNGGKIQTMDCLIEEAAYEHWHRMLFARFLAENNLLMYPAPDDPVAVTLEECEDLAADEGAANGWELAARFAARMLPQIFRLDSPVFQLSLPPEHQQKLERLVADLELPVFTASDSLGWVYQFWQAKKKEEVNASEVKIGARELPAVTQLFTEPYMVSFLLDNSLGAWFVRQQTTRMFDGKLSDFSKCAIEKLKNAESEDELRDFFGLPGVPLSYLRFVKTDNCTLKMNNSSLLEGKHWMPAAGWFNDWPDDLGNLKILDPCCGSGHFLIAAFLMLVPMYMEIMDLSAAEAAEAVLRNNIHGLEIDQRCVELAAFAMALTAWKFPGAGGYRVLPELNVACSGLSVSVAKEEWKQLGLGKRNLSIALDWMYDTFKNAPVLGSLLNPAETDATRLVPWNELSIALDQVLNQEQSEEQQEVTVVAQGLAKAAKLLAGHYQLVITNVPYLARGKQNEQLKDFCETNYPEAKNDLATVFLNRCLKLCVQGGTTSIVLPQNWLFLITYKKFREKLLKNNTWHLIARLGAKAFQTPMWDFNVQLITMSRGNSSIDQGGIFGNLDDGKLICGLDVSGLRTAAEKAAHLQTTEIKSVEQSRQLENPGVKIIFSEIKHEEVLSACAFVHYGSKPGQTVRVTRQFWEFPNYDPLSWMLMGSSPTGSSYYSGKSEVCYSLSAIEEYKIEAFGVRGSDAWGSQGIIISKMSNLPHSIFMGEFFDDNTCVIVPKKSDYLPAILCYMELQGFQKAVREINQKVSVTKETLQATFFDLDHWTRVAEKKYPHGLPKPYTDDPTQWIFHGHPCGSVVWDDKQKWTDNGPLRTDDTVLQVAVARLLGYRWPAELDTNMELAEEQREWVERCEELLPYSDKDGIVCIPPVRGEASASDRLLNLLAAAYGDTWSNDTLAALLKSADHADKTLETWLREKFFTQHCKLFQHRPFIWHIWDGLRDGFAALVNYHKLDAKLLETLIYNYLGDWISRQKQEIASGVDGAQERLAAAEALKKKLELILEGEAPYDIFVRWKSLEKQPIGWNPDLNDGVRLNIRPFLTVPDVGKKGAGVLRDKPNINWNKDPGRDVESAPWYRVFDGDRINDHHLTLAEKRAAKENAK